MYGRLVGFVSLELYYVVGRITQSPKLKGQRKIIFTKIWLTCVENRK